VHAAPASLALWHVLGRSALLAGRRRPLCRLNRVQYLRLEATPGLECRPGISASRGCGVLLKSFCCVSSLTLRMRLPYVCRLCFCARKPGARKPVPSSTTRAAVTSANNNIFVQLLQCLHAFGSPMSLWPRRALLADFDAIAAGWSNCSRGLWLLQR